MVFKIWRLSTNLTCCNSLASSFLKSNLSGTPPGLPRRPTVFFFLVSLFRKVIPSPLKRSGPESREKQEKVLPCASFSRNEVETHPYSQSYGFSSSPTYGYESWTIKKTECQRINAFKLWCWRRLSRVPWTARKSNQSILKEINPEYALEGLMLKVKLQFFGHLMQKANSLEKTLMLAKIEGRK